MVLCLLWCENVNNIKQVVESKVGDVSVNSKSAYWG